MSLKSIVASAAMLLCAASALAGQPLRLIGVASDGGGSSGLYEVDPATGDASLIGFTGASSMIGLAFDRSSGTLFGIDDRSDLWTLDPDTGAASFVGSGSGGFGEGGAVFTNDGALLASNDEELRLVDPGSGDSFLIGVHGPPGEDLSGMTIRPDGTLLGYAKRGFDTDHIVTIDRQTGEAAFLASLDADTPGDVGGLAWDASDGRLLVSTGDTLLRVDPPTDGFSIVGSHRIRGMSGIVFIPAPGVIGPLALGIGGLLHRRRARRTPGPSHRR